MSKNTRTTRSKPSRHKKPKVSPGGPPEVKPGHPDAHHGAPVKHCQCLCCWAHRRAWKRDEQDHQRAEAWERTYGHLPYDGQVHVAENTSQALREVLGATDVW